MKYSAQARTKSLNLIILKILKTVGLNQASHTNLADFANEFVAKEIEKLRQESQALKKIREAMGSEDFARRVFEKVFKIDIDRLRSMKDMWKIRTPPRVLDFDQISKEAQGNDVSVAQSDQVAWTLSQNFTVFQDRSGYRPEFFTNG